MMVIFKKNIKVGDKKFKKEDKAPVIGINWSEDGKLFFYLEDGTKIDTHGVKFLG